MKVRDVIKLIEADGWQQVRMKGDHRQYQHPVKKGLVTVAGHPADDLHPKTLISILKQAQIKRTNRLRESVTLYAAVELEGLLER